MQPRTLQVFFFLLFSAQKTHAHSWVEQLSVIAPNGTFVGAPGYPRGNVLRTASDFSDSKMTYLIPPSSRANVTLVLPTDKLCKDSQQEPTLTAGSARLQASAGDAIALRYQENGHVTLPWNQPGKPANRGNVYVYGTTNPKVGEKLLDVHGVWTSDGTGGDGRGVLLSKQNFDDGRCYQVNSGNISQARQQEYAHQANQLMGADMWCQQDLKLPSTAPSGKLYTLYWVWDWPTLPDVDPTYPEGKTEIYTTCMDVDVVASSSQKMGNTQEGYASGQDLNEAAIPSEFDTLEDVPQMTETTAPLSSMASSSTTTTDMPESTSTLYLTRTEVVRILTVTA
ncbi:hypothetical protein F1880_000505 [Penicillium rolfsii]|nr:hypothetical protein F1880_000505 [Penicillium rolfsii]